MNNTFYSAGMTLPHSFRMKQLQKLKTMLLEYEEELYEALYADLGKSRFESWETEIGPVLQEISYAQRHLESWMRPRRVQTSILHFPSSGKIIPEPYGTVLILSPWNYPVQLTLMPLAAAIAAGNCAVLSLPAASARTSEVLQKLLADAFAEEHVRSYLGDIPTNTELLREPFDYIFFTGSPRVGKIVMEAAAKNLTPVTLELGGKSPCIVDRTADISLAARRIVWGKSLNSGQTCVAPDYILAEQSVKGRLCAAIEKAYREFYGNAPITNPDYPKIINGQHFERLVSLFEGQKIVSGGRYDRESRKMELTVLDSPDVHAPVMEEEIFGPVLPVLSYETLDEAKQFVNSRPKPLALYLFTRSDEVTRRVMGEFSFGGGCVNDTVVHLVNHRLPFGGVGNSGMGRYHGKFGFDTFTHYKGVLKKGNWLDLSVRYPPYGEKLGLLKKMMK